MLHFVCIYYSMEHVLKHNIYTIIIILKFTYDIDEYVYLVLKNTAVETVEKGDKPLVGCRLSSS